MLACKEFLEQCQEAQWHGYRPKFVPGMRVGRGFADLGYEEFWVIAGAKVVSLLTGDIASFSELDREKFFHIPEADDVVDMLYQHGALEIQVHHVDSRVWRAVAVSEFGQRHQSEHHDLISALLGVFLECLQFGAEKGRAR